MHILDGITLSDRDGNLVASCRPVAGQSPIDPPALQGLIDEAGYGQWALMPDALTTLMQRRALGGDPFEQVLGRREDARFTIEVDRDGMRAQLKLSAARGGLPARLQDLTQALQAAGVVYGVDAAVLHSACEAVADVCLVVASGVAPVKGDDSCFELLVSDTRDRSPKVDEHGLIDYHELGDIPTVNTGQALMRRRPPTPGVYGCDVRGEPLAAIPGLDEPFDQPLAGAAVSPDNPNLLLAVDAGQPVRTRCGVMVEKVLRVKDVNLATGNLNFVGTIEVAGDVQPGMKVVASGDIVVKGLVEGAHLDAKGSIQVNGGVIAHGSARAAQSVSVRFVENSVIQAGTTIVVENMALHSDLQALNQVLIGTVAGARGRLIGGSTRATMLVQAPALGASAGGVTTVHVGVDPAFPVRCRDLDQAIEHERVEADKLERVLQHLQRNGDPSQMLAKVRPAWQQALKRWSTRLGERADLDRQLALTQSARIEVSAGVAGDVDIGFGKVSRQLRSGYGKGAFSVDEQGRVVFTPLDGGPAEIV